MFDLTSSKLLILGVIALIVVGPKELPFLLRTLGKYMAIVRRHANEFRAQFDEAMREAELEGIKRDLEGVARDAENTIRDAQVAVKKDLDTASSGLEQSASAEVPVPSTADAAAVGEALTHEPPVQPPVQDVEAPPALAHDDATGGPGVPAEAAPAEAKGVTNGTTGGHDFEKSGA